LFHENGVVDSWLVCYIGGRKNVPALIYCVAVNKFLNFSNGKSHENRISCFSFIVGCFGHHALGGA
jgi:hypothetical protein